MAFIPLIWRNPRNPRFKNKTHNSKTNPNPNQQPSYRSLIRVHPRNPRNPRFKNKIRILRILHNSKTKPAKSAVQKQNPCNPRKPQFKIKPQNPQEKNMQHNQKTKNNAKKQNQNVLSAFICVIRDSETIRVTRKIRDSEKNPRFSHVGRYARSDLQEYMVV